MISQGSRAATRSGSNYECLGVRDGHRRPPVDLGALRGGLGVLSRSRRSREWACWPLAGEGGGVADRLSGFSSRRCHLCRNRRGRCGGRVRGPLGVQRVAI